MTILGIFINNEIRTGANRRYLELMEGLAERGNTVTVIMNSSLVYEPAHFSRLDLDIVYKRGHFPPASLLLLRAVNKHLITIARQTGHIDWIHIHSDMHLSAAIFLKKKTGAKLFYAVRCDDISRSRILRKYLPMTTGRRIKAYLYEKIKKRYRESILARNADRITFQNNKDKDFFLQRNKFPEQNTTIIPGNIGGARFASKWKDTNRSSSVTNLVYCGSLSYSKGFHLVLQLVQNLKMRGYHTVKLLVLGRVVENDEMVLLSRSMGLDSMTEFVGYANPFEYFAKADLFVYPSLYDSWADVILEAMYTGCPVIASDTGGNSEILGHRELLFVNGEVSAMTDMVERMILDPEYYQHIRTLCSERRERFEFDWTGKFEEAMCKK